MILIGYYILFYLFIIFIIFIFFLNERQLLFTVIVTKISNNLNVLVR